MWKLFDPGQFLVEYPGLHFFLARQHQARVTFKSKKTDID